MGILISEYWTEIEYLNTFSIRVDSIYHDMIYFLYNELDKQDYTLKKLSQILKTPEREIHNWIRDPESITMKDIVKLEFILGVSVINVIK